MEILGYSTLIFFLVAMVLTLLKKINLPVQTVLVLVTLVCMLAGGIYYFFAEGEIAEVNAASGRVACQRADMDDGQSTLLPVPEGVHSKPGSKGIRRAPALDER